MGDQLQIRVTAIRLIGPSVTGTPRNVKCVTPKRRRQSCAQKPCTSIYSWRTCYPSDDRGASTTDAVPMSIPRCLRPSALLVVNGKPTSNTDYCCQIYVPFSDEDRRTSRDHPNPDPSSISSSYFKPALGECSIKRR